MICDHERLDFEELFSQVKDISSLAHFARCHAQEAEMRANYAINLAERATSEAEAVRNIAESLTKTARSVAKMSLEHINKMNSAEYRSFKRGEIINAVRSSCERKVGPEHHRNHSPSRSHRRQQAASHSIKREVLSEDTVVHTKLLTDRTPSPDDRPDNSPDTNNMTDTSRKPTSLTSAMTQPRSSDFLDKSDLLLCVESLHRQSSPSNSQFSPTEVFPDTEEVKLDIAKDFDSTETLPIVWEDSYQGQSGRKPMPWSDKKSIRKMQRKLRDLDVTEDCQGSEIMEGDPEIQESERDCTDAEEPDGLENDVVE